MSSKISCLFTTHNAREEAEQYHRFTIEPENVMRAEKAAAAQHLGISPIRFGGFMASAEATNDNAS